MISKWYLEKTSKISEKGVFDIVNDHNSSTMDMCDAIWENPQHGEK